MYLLCSGCLGRLGQDAFGAGGIDAMMIDIQVDGEFQLHHAGELVAADALVGDVAEESPDHVQPRGAGWGEAHSSVYRARCFASSLLLH